MNSASPTNNPLDFNNLVQVYYTPLYRFAYSLAKNEEDACDLTQQVFFIWAQKGSSLRDPSKVKSWLFTTLYREFLRVKKRASSMAPYDPDVLESEVPAFNPDIVATLDAASAVESLAEVDEIYRVPLTLFYLKSLSYKEIASTLDLPIGTVMSRLSRGKSQLKEILLGKRPSNQKTVPNSLPKQKDTENG